MGLTNEQWKQLYNAEVERFRKEAARTMDACVKKEEIIEHLSQAMSDAMRLRDFGSSQWTSEQVSDCGQVIVDSINKALEAATSMDVCRQSINGAR